MFQISDKVVCVDDHSTGMPLPDGVSPVVKGVVYVIRDVWTEPRFEEGYLVQIVGSAEATRPTDGARRGWRPSRFRKLSDVQAENAAKRKESKSKPYDEWAYGVIFNNT